MNIGGGSYMFYLCNTILLLLHLEFMLPQTLHDSKPAASSASPPLRLEVGAEYGVSRVVAELQEGAQH